MFQGALAYICKEKNVPILEPLCLGLSYVKKKTCPFWSLYVYFLGRSKTRFNWMIPKLSPFSIRQYQAGHSCVSGGLSYVKKKACPFFNNRNLSGRTTAPNSTQTHLSCPALLEILVAHGSRKHQIPGSVDAGWFWKTTGTELEHLTKTTFPRSSATKWCWMKSSCYPSISHQEDPRLLKDPQKTIHKPSFRRGFFLSKVST